LVVLDIEACPQLTDLSPLAGLPALSLLYLVGLDRLGDPASLGTLPILEQLVVRHCPELRSLHGLGEQPRLEELQVDGCRNLRELGSLGHLRALRELRVEDCPSLLTLEHVGELPALEEVWISDCAVLGDVAGLTGSPVRDLGLSNLPVMADFAVPGLAHLRTLKVYRCPRVRTVLAERCEHVLLFDTPWKDLSGLRAGPALREIQLFSDDLADISALAELPGLVDVDIDFCTRLKDWSPLLDIPALERVKPPRHQVYDIEQNGGTDPVLDALAARGVTRYE
jgi:internalin A